MNDETWRKASYSEAGNCVEVGQADSDIAVRDTKDRDGATLAFSPQAWREFAARVAQPA